MPPGGHGSWGLELGQIPGLWSSKWAPWVKNKDKKKREGPKETFGENRREVWLMDLMGRLCYMRKSKAHTEIHSFSGIIALCVCVVVVVAG